MKRFTLPRTIALTLTCALSLAASSRMLRADEAKPAEPNAPAAAAPAPAPDAPAADSADPVGHQPEPDLIEEVKLIKVDADGKTVTVLVSPDKAKSGRAYKQMKFTLDDHSLIMIDQQPSSMAALAKGMIVNVSHLKKGKNDVVDTIVVLKSAEPE